MTELNFIFSLIPGLPHQPDQRDGHLLGRVLRAVQGRLPQAKPRGRRKQAEVLEHVPRALSGVDQSRKQSLQLHDQSAEIASDILSEEVEDV